MCCQAGFDPGLTTIRTHLLHVHKPQTWGWALCSFGMVLVRSCALQAWCRVWWRRLRLLRATSVTGGVLWHGHQNYLHLDHL